MTNKEIYKGALALIAEPTEYGAADYAERAPYIIANFISEHAALDNHYRRTHGEKEQTVDCPVYASLDDDFPLSARFVPAAEQYLASMLIADEDMERSDACFDRFCKAMTVILSEIPAVVEQITSVYDM